MINEELQVLITAQNAQLLSAIDESTKKLEALAKGAQDSGKKTSASLDSIGKDALKLGLAATAAAGGALYLFKTLADGVDQTNQLGKSLGISYNEMARLNYIAKQAGTEQSALTASLRIMNRQFGEIANGGGKDASVAIQRLGLSVADLQGMNASEKFEAIAGALKGVDDAAVRASLANDIFGKGAQQIMPMILDDVQGLSKEFNSLGVELTALDVQALDNAGDAIDRLQTTVTMAAQKFAAELAPAIEAGVDMLQEIITGNHDLGNSAESGASIATFAIGKFLDILMGLKGAIELGTAALMNLGAYGVDVFGFLLDGVNKLYYPFQQMINGWIQIHNLVFKDEQWPLLGDLTAAVSSTKELADNLHNASAALAEKGVGHIADAFAGTTSKEFFSRTEANRAKAGAQAGASSGVSQTDLQNIQTDEQMKADAAQKAKDAAALKAHEADMKRAEEWAGEQRISALTEDEEILAKYKRQMEMLNEYHDQKLVSEESYSQTSLALQEKLNQDITANAAKRAAKERAIADARLSQQKQEFMSSIATAASSNKQFFELHKALQLAQAALNIPAAVSGAYAVGAKIGGPALGAVFGATAFAAQVINMQSIASQSFGGAASATGGGGGGSAPASSLPAATAAPAGDVQAPRNDKVTTVSLQGDNFSRAGVRGLLELLAEELADGGLLRTT